MNTKLQRLLQSLCLTFACILIVSLVLSTLYFFHLIDTPLFHILNWLLGILSYGIGGVYLGFVIQKKALLHAFINAFIFTIIMLLIHPSFTLINVLQMTSKLFVYLLSCVIAHNIKH